MPPRKTASTSKSSTTKSGTAKPAKQSLYQEYFSIVDEYEEKFGEMTLVMMQKGNFYEIYEVDLPHMKKGKCKEISRMTMEDPEILQELKLTKINPKEHSENNPYMVGIPLLSFNKWKRIFLAKDYIIVRVDEFSGGSSDNGSGCVSKGRKARKVTEVISVGTDVNAYTSVSSNIVCFYIESCDGKSSGGKSGVGGCGSSGCDEVRDAVNISVGMSSIDLISGKSVVKESFSTVEQPHAPLEVIEKFLIDKKPLEVIVYLQDFEDPERYFKKLKKTVALFSNVDKVHVHNKIEPPFCKTSYQEQFLKKIFSIESCLSPLDVLFLNKQHFATISYVALLQFCYEYNDKIVSRINKPLIENASDRMLVPSNTIEQLNLLSNGQLELNHNHKSINSLFSIINHTRTAMGKRYLKDMIMRPYIDPKQIQQTYDIVEGWLGARSFLGTSLLEAVDVKLKKIPDLERYHRKILTNSVQPYELGIFLKGYLQIVEIANELIKATNDGSFTSLSASGLKMNSGSKKKFVDIVNFLRKVLNLDVISNGGCKVGNGYFEFSHLSPCSALKAPFKNVDEILRRAGACLKSSIFNTTSTTTQFSKDYQECVETWTENVAKLVEKKEEYDAFLEIEKVNFDYIDDMYCITTSAIRAKKLKEQFGLSSRPSKANRTEMFDDELTRYSEAASKSKKKLDGMCLTLYKNVVEIVAHLGDSESGAFNDIMDFITQVDYTSNIAKASIANKYFRPEIKSQENKGKGKSEDGSFFEMEDVRHPIIERIIDEEYVTNDLSLGGGTVVSPRGLLLYGPNSIGKTSMAKSVGCILIMAQMGYYVPCKLVYKPYKKIMTRLCGNDNIYKGQSSFVVEMSELRLILKNADSSSLILGDELCRGTESISGTSLTISAIANLIEKKSSFIFATHMHHIPTNEHVTPFIDRGELSVKHLQIVYDDTRNLLVYDRKLKDGSGDSMYGLEIAKSLDLDKDFLKLANEVRRELESIDKQFLPTKSSVYNSTIYVDECTMCKTKANKAELHTHHIKEQHDADETGYIGHVHKNSACNLIIICRACHNKTHCDKINVRKKMTTKGLQITFSPPK